MSKHFNINKLRSKDEDKPEGEMREKKEKLDMCNAMDMK